MPPASCSSWRARSWSRCAAAAAAAAAAAVLCCRRLRELIAPPPPAPPVRPLQTAAPPAKLKRKMVYFLKLSRVSLLKEGFDKQVGAAVSPLRAVVEAAAPPHWIPGSAPVAECTHTA